MAEIDDIDSFNTTQGEECVGVRIYALKDPIDGQIRYIGKTIFNLKKRLTEHLHEAFDVRSPGFKSQKSKWIRGLFEKDKLPYAEQIDFASENWAEREIHWIKYYRDNGANLTNIHDGGEWKLKPKRIATIEFDSFDSVKGLLSKITGYTADKTKSRQIIALAQMEVEGSEKIKNKYVAMQVYCYLYVKGSEGSTVRDIAKIGGIKCNDKNDVDEAVQDMIDCGIFKGSRITTKGRPRVAYFIKEFFPDGLTNYYPELVD